MKATIPISVPPGTRLLRIAREPKVYGDFSIDDGYWIIWLHTRDFIHGTFLRLHDNGKIESVTIREDRPDEEIFVVKPPDD